MVIIKDLVKSIKEECKAAKEYAKLAVQYKTENKAIADVYAKTAEVELGHINQFHELAVKIIKEYQAKGETPPPAMKVVWDWEHEAMADAVAQIKTLLEWYKMP